MVVVLVVLAAGIDDDEVRIEIGRPQIHRYELSAPSLEGVSVPVFAGAQRGVARRQAAALRSHPWLRSGWTAGPDPQLVRTRFVLCVGSDDDAVRTGLFERELEP